MKVYDTPIVWYPHKFVFVKKEQQPKPIEVKPKEKKQAAVTEPQQLFDAYKKLEHSCFINKRYCYDIENHPKEFDGWCYDIFNYARKWILQDVDD